MATTVTISIDTDDMDLVERIGRAVNGNLTEVVEGGPSVGVREHDRQMREEFYGHEPAGASTTACDDQDAAEERPEVSDADMSAAEATVASSDGGTAGPVDHNGVPKDDRYCGNAAEPFYSSGKRTGQWKKKKGVSDQDYDAWYAEQLQQVQASQPEQEQGEDDHQPGPVDTSGAFSGGYLIYNGAKNVPQDAGTFMGWVAEKQAAQLLTQADIDYAWNQAGLSIGDIFPPNDQQAIAERIGQLYAIMSQKAGA